jgi:hypothetical protein
MRFDPPCSNSVSGSATSVRRVFPSSATNFNRLHFVTDSLSYLFRWFFKTFQLVGRVERSETRRHPLFIANMLFEYNLIVRTPIVMINSLFHIAMKGRMRPEFRRLRQTMLYWIIVQTHGFARLTEEHADLELLVSFLVTFGEGPLRPSLFPAFAATSTERKRTVPFTVRE